MQRRILTWIILAALFLPVVHMVMPLIPAAKTFGVEKGLARVPLTLANLSSGEFQKYIEQLARKTFYFRGYLRRLDNQIDFSLFRENKVIVVGKDNWLYEKHYIDAHNARFTADRAHFKATADTLAVLKSKLMPLDTRLLVMITPSKASVYPEYIPNKYLLQLPLARRSENYDLLLLELQNQGIDYIDGRDFLLKLKTAGNHKVFVKGGTHWSHYGACRFTQYFLQYLDAYIGKRLNPLNCDPLRVDQNAFGTDRDLADVLNLIDMNTIRDDVTHPRISYPRESDRQAVFRPKIIYVGGSFIHNIRKITGQSVFRSSDLYYYNSRVFSTDQDRNGKKTSELDIESELRDADILVLEVNEAMLPNIGSGFPDQVIKLLGEAGA